jgi:hypothetical protein
VRSKGLLWAKFPKLAWAPRSRGRLVRLGRVLIDAYGLAFPFFGFTG